MEEEKLWGGIWKESVRDDNVSQGPRKLRFRAEFQPVLDCATVYVSEDQTGACGWIVSSDCLYQEQYTQVVLKINKLSKHLEIQLEDF